MNCKQIQDLMPLYVGGELEERRVRLVAAHVQNCKTCLDVAREYRETRQLLHTFVPPRFTDDFYAQMRQSVWQNVEKKSRGPALSSIIAELFRPRVAWALATAVLIVVSVVGVYVISRSAAPQPVVSHQPKTTHTTRDDQPATSSQDQTSTAPARTSSDSNSQRESVHQADSAKKRKTIPDRAELRAVSTVAAVSPAATSAPATNDLRQPSNGSSDHSPAPLRLEIQTENPNIRIIWFARRDIKQPFSNSKGT